MVSYPMGVKPPSDPADDVSEPRPLPDVFGAASEWVAGDHDWAT